MKFRFKLRRLLRVREVGEELARSELLAAEAGAEAARVALEAARADLIEAEQELLRVRSNAGAGAAVLAERTLPPRLRRIATSRQRLHVAEREADAARDAWRAQRTDVRALEKLQERERVAFEALERAREDRALQETLERRAALADRPREITESKA